MGALLFTLGGLLDSVVPRFAIAENRKFALKTWHILFLLLVCMTFLMLQINIVVSVEGDTLAKKLIYTRYLESIENKDVFGVIKYASSLNLAVLLLICIRLNSNQRRRFDGVFFILFLVISLVSAFFSTGRTPIIITMMIISMAYLLGGDGKIIVGRAVQVGFNGIFFVAAVYWGVGLVFGKVGDTQELFLFGIGTYLFSGLPALDAFLDTSMSTSTELGYGANLLRFIPAVLAKIGLVSPPAPLVQEFVDIPHSTNLYTIYHILILDFGVVFACIFPIFLGFFHGHVFRVFKSDPSNVLYRFFYIYSFVPLIQVVFQEVYFSLLSTWIQLALLSILLTTKNSKWAYKA
jgi:oligosaccharide repeat unit polymerase